MPRNVSVQLTLPDKNSIRAVWCIGMVFLCVALALNAVATISLPLVPNTDIARVQWDLNNNGSTNAFFSNITQIQFGVWSDCAVDTSGNTTCSAVSTANGFVSLVHSLTSLAQSEAFDRDKAITRGIRLIPFGFMAVFLAFFLAIFQATWVIMFALITTFVAVVFTGGALLYDVLLFLKLQKRANEMESGITVLPGVGLFLTAASTVLILLALIFLFFNGLAVRRESNIAPSSTVTKDTRA